MLDQSFTTKNFVKVLKKRDIVKYRLGSNKDEVYTSLSRIEVPVNENLFSISPFIVNKRNKKYVYSASSLEDDFVLKKLNFNLKRIFKVKQANRHLIIKQIKTLISEEVPMTIIKLDIKDFYETINPQKVLAKIQRNTILSHQSKIFLDQALKNLSLQNSRGLPRGINISATLSELFLRDFDKKIIQSEAVYYYARYVDDIIIFSYKKNDDSIIEFVRKELKKYGLSLNDDKTYTLRVDCRCATQCVCNNTNCECLKKCKCKNKPAKRLSFTYLGYIFEFNDFYSKRDITIDIAPRKIKKIKSRIVYSYLQFLQDSIFSNLILRIKFLSGNYCLSDDPSLSKLRGGVFYNYPYINKVDGCDELTTFHRKLINSKRGAFGRKISRKLTPVQKGALAKYNFRFGQEKGITHNFTYEQISEIKKSWRNE